MLLSELISKLEGFWPPDSAEEWDRVGLLVGDPGSQVSKILVSVDITEAVILEASETDAQLIVSHHPFLLKGVNSLAEDELKGRLVALLNRTGISNFAAHTNADVQPDGASSEMAERFGVGKLSPLIPVPGSFGHGVLGTLSSPVTLREFASMVSEKLPTAARSVVFSGDPHQVISKVAICSGAGDSLLPVVLKSDADVFVTSDLRHHPALDAIESPRPRGRLSLVDVSHWASESLWVDNACVRLKKLSGLVVLASGVRTDPWTEQVVDD